MQITQEHVAVVATLLVLEDQQNRLIHLVVIFVKPTGTTWSYSAMEVVRKMSGVSCDRKRTTEVNPDIIKLHRMVIACMEFEDTALQLQVRATALLKAS